MSGLQARGDDTINGVDVRERGSALRVATSTPHLVSLGTGRLSTAVTLHPIKQGRVTIGSDPTCDIYVVGAGVAAVHCRVENSHGVVTLYPLAGSTLMDAAPVDTPTRLSQGCMLTIGRSNYLRFNNPAEAALMKSVLPSGHCSPGYNHTETNQSYQNMSVQQKYKENTLSQLDQELDMTLKEMSRKKPPTVPRKPYRDLDLSDSDQDKPKVSSIMAKVSKFEYYAKQQKNIGRSQFYTSHENEISPKVFSSNSLTVNTPAKDVLGVQNIPNYMRPKQGQKTLELTENNTTDVKNTRNFSYTNVAIRNKTKIEDIVRNFDENPRLPKKINNDQQNVYGKINGIKNSNLKTADKTQVQKDSNVKMYKTHVQNDSCKADYAQVDSDTYGRIDRAVNNVTNVKPVSLPSSAYDRNPQYSPVYANSYYDRSYDAEHMRVKAYRDRIKEEEQKEAETARLEEILNMCAEYERQIASGSPLTPTEKRAHNKIITNGSLPRSAASNNPNFVQTSDGYYKFETSHNRNSPMSQSLQRNVSSYENIDTHSHIEPLTPEVTIRNPNFENASRMDEIGIPVFESPKHGLSSPIMIRKLQNADPRLTNSPIGSPYENVYFKTNGLLKPKSPNTQSPRSRIKTTFAHKNLPSPQYFVFPTPPPVDKEPNFNQITPKEIPKEIANSSKTESPKENLNSPKPESPKERCFTPKTEKIGIEKQLSLEEEIPMIDDSSVSDEIEFRTAKIERTEQNVDQTEKQREIKDDVTETKDFIQQEIEITPEKLTKNKSFDDVKKELMADIPELEEFERDLQEGRRDKTAKQITEVGKKNDFEADSIDSVLDENVEELKSKFEKLKEERKKLVSDIHEIKCKMSEIRSQEDDILRELEMEKALIKGEYDSEIAILNIEQKKKAELADQAKKIEEEIRLLKERQEARQNEMRDRVEIATLKIERIEKDLKNNSATLEELQNAQDILDNETKISEDLEFQHLEEESELLANREDIQNEIVLLTKKIDAQKSRILTLKSEANDNLTSALDETKILQAEYVRLLNQVEDLTGKVQSIEKELKPLVVKLNDIERTQSPDSAFYTDQTRAKSGEFGYSPQSSDSDDMDLAKLSNFEDRSKQMKDKFNSIDQMSQSMIVDIDRRVVTDMIEIEIRDNGSSESPSKSSTSSKEKKGFWERNFDSLKRKKKQKSPDKMDIMSQSLNENFFYNNENIENEPSLDRFNSLRHSKKKEKEKTGPVKSSSSSKIPTFAALGKIIKKDSFGKKTKENFTKPDTDTDSKSRYVKNAKMTTDNKYKAKSLTPDKTKDSIKEEEEKESDKYDKNNLKPEKDLDTDKTPKPDKAKIFDNLPRKASLDNTPKILHRKSCGDEPYGKTMSEFQKISDSGKIPSQDDIDRISKVTIDAPLLSSDTDMNSLGKRTLDSFMEIERKRMEMLEEQGCQVIENEREKISALKRRAQDETKKLWDQKNREKSVDSDYQSVNENSNQSDIVNHRQNVSNQPDTVSVQRQNIRNESNTSNHRQNVSNQSDFASNNRQNVSNQSDFVSNHRQNVSYQCDAASNHRQNVNNQSQKLNNQSQNLSNLRQNISNQTQNVSSLRQNVSNNLQNVSNQYQSLPPDFGRRPERCDKSILEDSSLGDDSFNMTSSSIFDSSGLMSSSSIEELPVRNSRADSTEDDKRSDESRPLSNASDFSRDNILSLGNMGRRTRRGVAPSDASRPLTRYLPQDTDDFDLRRHVESAGHQIELCPYVTVSTSSCRGYLHKLGAKFHTWSKRWFVFDRESKTFVYYWDKSEKKPRGGAYFQVIEEVYLDHGNTSKSPSPATTFIVKTRQRRYYLMAPSGEAARIWIDVIFTGAQGYTEYME